jgi:hypothetical protein
LGQEEAAALAVAADGRQRRLVQALRGLAQQLGLEAEVAGGQLQRLVIEGLAAELVAQLRLVGGQAVQGGDGEQAGEGGVRCGAGRGAGDRRGGGWRRAGGLDTVSDAWGDPGMRRVDGGATTAASRRVSMMRVLVKGGPGGRSRPVVVR